MNTKIVGIIICMLLTATILPVVSSLNKKIENNDYNDNISNETLKENNCGCGTNLETKISNPKAIKYYKKVDTSDTFHKKLIMDDLPEYFSWRDYNGKDWTTCAKNQDWPICCGCCWDFAALGALESIINIREGRDDLDVDLSEQYVLSCLPRAGDCFIGGNAYNAYYYIMCNRSSGNNCNGIIPETCFPYRGIDSEGYDFYGQNHDPVLCEEKCINWEQFLIPITNFGRWYPNGSPEDIQAIKTQIMQHGPVTTNMMATYYIHGEDNFDDWGYEHQQPDDYYSTTQQFNYVNHVVVLIGWKDDPSIQNGGYWICKNSDGGQEWGYDGFFNIEYGTLNIDSFQIVWVEYNPNIEVNWEPVANAGENIYASIDEEIIFDGTNSFDHEGQITSYSWDFGDGTNGSGQTTTHTYNSKGIYSVILTISDNQGNMKNDSIWAFIDSTNEPPNTPTVHGPSIGKPGTEYDYTFSAIDPDGNNIYYFIYWGDWTFDSWIGPFPSGEEVVINHTFPEKATYNIRVKVKDCFDAKSDWVTLAISMPKNNPFNFNLDFLHWLLERFPHSFSILKQLLRLTGG